MQIFPRIAHSLSCAGLAITIVSSPSAAQFVFEARQGTTWADKLVVPDGSTMTFRWKWDGRGDLNGAAWQMTFTSPAARGEPAIVKVVSVALPNTRLYEYGTFQIFPAAIPSSAPSTFYVRMRSGENYSSWIPVTVTEPVRAVTTLAPPPLTTASVAPTPLMTTGVENPNPPLWIKLTKIICLAESSDGSASDEVYAIVGSVALNHKEPWNSAVWADGTTLYEDMDASDFRAPNLTLWGPPYGSPLALSKPGDAIILYTLREHDWGSPSLAKAGALGSLSATAKTLNPDMSYGQMQNKLLAEFRSAVFVAGAGSGLSERDDEIGATAFLTLSQGELDDARAGKIVKKEVTTGSGQFGVYVLRFQIGRAGTTTEPW